MTAYRLRVDDQQIVLLDTPGFDDTYRGNSDVLTDIAYWLTTSYVQGYRLTAILYLHRITDVRLYGSSIRNLRLFGKIIGDGACGNVTLLTTMWAQVDPAIGTEREQALVNSADFWGSLGTKGAKVARFDGTREGAQLIIRSQLNNAGRTLTLQREMIQERLLLIDTQAGKQLVADLEEVRAGDAGQLVAFGSEMEEAFRRKDGQLTKVIADMSRKHTQEIANVHAANEAIHARDRDIEALQNRHERERKHLADRIQFLEKQTTGRPTAYEEQELEPSTTIPNTARPRLIMFSPWTMFTYFSRHIRLLLRPRLSAGYRRLEWTCVCFTPIPFKDSTDYLDLWRTALRGLPRSCLWVT